MPTRRKFRRNNRNKNKSRRKRQRGGKIQYIDNDTLTNILKGDEWKKYLTVDKFKDRKEGKRK